MTYQFEDGIYIYWVQVDGFETYQELAKNRNQAISKSYKKYRAAGYNASYTEFKKMVVYAKRYSEKLANDL